MTFSSLIFIFVFLPLFILSYFVFKNRMYRNLIILVFSLAFYAWGEPIYILLMLFSITINYLLALFIDKSVKTKRKVFLMTPYHHHLEKKGWDERDIVKFFWVIGLILSMSAIVFGVWI